MTSTTSDRGRPPDSKAVLFCFDCGHESPVTGDWDRERRDGRTAYRCPDCGTTISVRPEDDSIPTSERGETVSYGVGD